MGILRLDEVSKDSAVPGLSREETYSHVLPLPSYTEQEVVAEFLDKKTAEIEAIQEKIEKAVDNKGNQLKDLPPIKTEDLEELLGTVNKVRYSVLETSMAITKKIISRV